jgi:hypothetical protein
MAAHTTAPRSCVNGPLVGKQERAKRLTEALRVG